jgi:hypothetical protein
MNLRRRVALTLLAALFTLAFPAAASAVVYTVDSTGDQEDLLPGTGRCVTSVATCTLRAAIEESNASPLRHGRNPLQQRLRRRAG